MHIVEAKIQRLPKKVEVKPANQSLLEAFINARPEEPKLDPLGNGRLTCFQEDQALLRTAVDIGIIPQIMAKFDDEELVALLGYFKADAPLDTEDEESEDNPIDGILNRFSIEVANLALKK